MNIHYNGNGFAKEIFVYLENPETLTIKIQLSLTTKWIDNQQVSWSIKTGKAWSKGPDFPHYPQDFQFASEELKNSREFVLSFVSKFGDVLEFVKEEFQNDKEIVLAAISENSNAFEFASEELKKDKDILLAIS